MSEESFDGCSARAEARGLLRLLLAGSTVEELRELIAVPPRIERVLQAYTRAYPEEAPSVERNLKFTRVVAGEFARLVCWGVPTPEMPEADEDDWVLLGKPSRTRSGEAKRVNAGFLGVRGLRLEIVAPRPLSEQKQGS